MLLFFLNVYLNMFRRDTCSQRKWSNIHYTMLMHVLGVFKTKPLRTRQQNLDTEVNLLVPFPNFPWSHDNRIQKKYMTTEVFLPSIDSFSRSTSDSKTVKHTYLTAKKFSLIFAIKLQHSFLLAFSLNTCPAVQLSPAPIPSPRLLAPVTVLVWFPFSFCHAL